MLKPAAIKAMKRSGSFLDIGAYSLRPYQMQKLIYMALSLVGKCSDDFLALLLLLIHPFHTMCPSEIFEMPSLGIPPTSLKLPIFSHLSLYFRVPSLCIQLPHLCLYHIFCHFQVNYHSRPQPQN